MNVLRVFDFELFRNVLWVNDKTINFCFYIYHENGVKSLLNMIY